MNNSMATIPTSFTATRTIVLNRPKRNTEMSRIRLALINTHRHSEWQHAHRAERPNLDNLTRMINEERAGRG